MRRIISWMTAAAIIAMSAGPIMAKGGGGGGGGGGAGGAGGGAGAAGGAGARVQGLPRGQRAARPPELGPPVLRTRAPRVAPRTRARLVVGPGQRQVIMRLRTMLGAPIRPLARTRAPRTVATQAARVGFLVPVQQGPAPVRQLLRTPHRILAVRKHRTSPQPGPRGLQRTVPRLQRHRWELRIMDATAPPELSRLAARLVLRPTERPDPRR